MGHRPLGILLALHFMVVAQRTVVFIDDREHGIVDGLQGNVLCGLLLLFQTTDGRCQRVGSHLGLQARVQQCRLQQLTIRPFLTGLRLYLLQMGNSRLGEVLLLGLFHLFPQRLIGLS